MTADVAAAIAEAVDPTPPRRATPPRKPSLRCGGKEKSDGNT
jgi:hypothetical protein